MPFNCDPTLSKCFKHTFCTSCLCFCTCTWWLLTFHQPIFLPLMIYLSLIIPGHDLKAHKWKLWLLSMPSDLGMQHGHLEFHNKANTTCNKIGTHSKGRGVRNGSSIPSSCPLPGYYQLLRASGPFLLSPLHFSLFKWCLVSLNIEPLHRWKAW